MKKRMLSFNYWRRGKQIKIFVPRTVVEVKAGKPGKYNSQSSCAGGCGGSCTNSDD
jgi:hypothetical protein